MEVPMKVDIRVKADTSQLQEEELSEKVMIVNCSQSVLVASGGSQEF
jgi:hypothetical protein